MAKHLLRNLALYVIYCLITQTSTAQTPLTCFVQTNYLVSNGANSIVSADFNRDGRPDVAASNYGSGYGPDATILFADSTGHLGNMLLLDSTYGSADIITADFNHDSIADIITVHYINNSYLMVYLGNGSGGFSTGDSIQLSMGYAITLSYGDFNNDNNNDLALVHSNWATGDKGVLAILTGNGSGGFTGSEIFIDSVTANAVGAADFNSDNKTDIVLAGGVNLFYYAGNGSGGFAPVATFVSGVYTSQANNLVVCDYNRDGKKDVVVVNVRSINFMAGDGAGSFTPNTYTNITGYSGAVADFNGDSINDFIGTGGAQTPGIMNGSPGGGFETVYDYSTYELDLNHITTADFNSDGYMDFATTTGCCLQLFLNSMPNDTPVTMTITHTDITCNGYNNGSATITATGGVQPFSYYWYPGNLTTHYGGLQASMVTGWVIGANGCLAKQSATIIEPAALAVTLTSDLPCGSAATLTAHPTGGTQPYTYTWFNIAPAQHTQSASILTAGNYKVKVIDANGCSINSAQVYMPIEPRFTAAELYDTPSSPGAIATADFNNDGIKDIVTANSGSSSVTLLTGHAGGHLTVANSFSIGSNLAPVPAIAASDFNADGNQDVMLTSQAGDTLIFLAGNGNGSFNAAVSLYSGYNFYNKSMLTADLNVDGKMDIILSGTNNPNTSIGILLNNGNGTFTTRLQTDGTSRFARLIAADFNNDNIPDLISTTPYNDSLSVFLGYGNGYFHGAIHMMSVFAPNVLASGDFNHDNNMDMVVTSLYNSGCGIFLGDGTGHFTSKGTFGNANVVDIATGDFDGDSNLDLALAVPNGVVVRLGTDTGTFLAPVNFASGVITPKAIITADFNNDGQPDIATPNGTQNKTSVLFDCVIYSGLQAVKQEPTFTVYPNPATDRLNITIDETMVGAQLNIYNTTGALVQTVSLSGSNTQLSITGLSAGLYIAEVSLPAGQAGNKVYSVKKRWVKM